MASKLPSPSNLAWSLIIEALSSSNQVDTSLLVDIVKKAPEFPDVEVGKNCREVLSLRFLEGLIAKGNQNKNKNASVVGQKLELDLSYNCEAVFRDVLKVSAKDLTAVAPEMFNGDVQSFIVHKRDSLPKPALQKLKDAILEGSHPALASLKERSGLTVTPEHHDDNSVNGGSSNVLAQRLEDCCRNDTVTLQYGNTSSAPRDSLVGESLKNLPHRKLLPGKRKTAAMTSEIVEIQTNGDQMKLDGYCTSHVQDTRKPKQKANATGDTVLENVIDSSMDGPLTTVYEGGVGCIEKDGCEKEVQGGSSTPQNVDDDLEGNFPDSNLLRAKRNKTAIAAENSESTIFKDQIPSGDACDFRGEVVKKFKQDCNSIMVNIDEDSVASPVHGLMTISSEETVGHVEKGGCYLEKQVEVGGIESNESSHCNDNQHPGLNRLAQSSDGSHHDHLVCPLQVPGDKTRVAEFSVELDGQKNGTDKSDGHNGGFELQTANAASLTLRITEKNTSPENPMNNFEGNFQVNFGGCGADDDVQHNPDFDMTSDSDDYHDERMDISLRKDALLSSQCTNSQDSLATQAKHCIKCDKEGQLLVCSSDTCTLAVHSSCLPSAATFDGNGKFYCPFCMYSRALSEYMLVKRKTFLLRKDLASFIDMKTTHPQKKPTTNLGKVKRNQLQKKGESHGDDEGNDGGAFVNKVSDSHSWDKMGNKHQTEPPLSCSSDHSHLDDKVVTLSDELPNVLVRGTSERKDKKATTKSGRVERNQLQKKNESHGENDGNDGEAFVNRVSDSHSRDKMGNKHQTEPPLSSSNCHSHSGEKMVTLSDRLPNALVKGNLERKDKKQQCQSRRGAAAQPVHGSDVNSREGHTADGNEGNAGAHAKKVLEIPESALQQDPVCGPICESSGEDDAKSARGYSLRLQNPMKGYTYPAVPQLRRKVLPWTKVEEEKLKEGVQMLSSAEDRSIPWKKILEYGGDVFQRGRTTVDLKDKWRNICKGGP